MRIFRRCAISSTACANVKRNARWKALSCWRKTAPVCRKASSNNLKSTASCHRRLINKRSGWIWSPRSSDRPPAKRYRCARRSIRCGSSRNGLACPTCLAKRCVRRSPVCQRCLSRSSLIRKWRSYASTVCAMKSYSINSRSYGKYVRPMDSR